MSFWKWSRVAATNATADGSINWSEGQSPSSVNDSARAMMAAASKYRDDIAGAIATGGTSTAYTVTSYQVFDTLANMNGAMIAFTPHATNGATVTLNVDGLGAKPLRSAPSLELPSNSLIVGTPYVATYYNSTAEWILQGGVSNPYNIPLGAGLDFWGTTAPNSAFAFPYGQAISRTTYATLFSLIGTTYGSGDGSTTFNLPDKRGRISTPLDNLGGSTGANRIGSIGGGITIGAAGGAETVTIAASNLPVTAPWGATAGSIGVSGTTNAGGAHTHTGTTDSGGGQLHNHNYTAPTNTNFAVQSGSSQGGMWNGSTTTTTGAENQSLSHTHTFTTASSAEHQHSFTATGSGPTITMGSNSGGGQATNKMPPVIVTNYILRVL